MCNCWMRWSMQDFTELSHAIICPWSEWKWYNLWIYMVRRLVILKYFLPFDTKILHRWYVEIMLQSLWWSNTMRVNSQYSKRTTTQMTNQILLSFLKSSLLFCAKPVLFSTYGSSSKRELKLPITVTSSICSLPTKTSEYEKMDGYNHFLVWIEISGKMDDITLCKDDQR